MTTSGDGNKGLDKRIAELERLVGELQVRVKILEQGDTPAVAIREGIENSAEAPARSTAESSDDLDSQATMILEAPHIESAATTEELSQQPPPLPPPLPKRPPAATTSPFNEQASIKATPQATYVKDIYESRPDPLRKLLIKCHLWPPSGGGSSEVQLGAWWATRIGMLLALIGIVSFAVYVTRRADPAIRLAQLVLASGGLTILGRWLERRDPRIGRVIFAGGLAAIYFTSFAAHAVAATRVIANPGGGALLQFGTVAALIFIAQRRNSAGLATLTLFFGYVTCLFSLWAGLTNHALLATLGLGAAAIYMQLVPGWRYPLRVAVPLTYVVYALIAIFGWIAPNRPPSFAFHLAYPLACLLMFSLPDLLTRWRALIDGTVAAEAGTHEVAWDARIRRALLIFNSSAAAVIAFAITHRLFHAHLTAYYFVFGCALLGLSFAYWLVRQPTSVMHALFVKGSALVTMGLITWLDARTRWIALAIECVVLLFSARRMRLKIMEGATGVAWLLSYAFFMAECLRSSGPMPTDSPFTLNAILATSYLGLSTALLCFYLCWFGSPMRMDRHSPPGILPETLATRETISAILGGLIGVGAWQASYVPLHLIPLALTSSAVLLALVALACRHVVGVIPALVPFIAAHEAIWSNQPYQLDRTWLATSAAAIIGVTIFATRIPFRGAESQEDSSTEPHGANMTFLNVILGLHALWTFTLMRYAHQSLDHAGYLLMASLTAILMALAAGLFPRPRLADASFLPIFFAVLGSIFTASDWMDSFAIPPGEPEGGGYLTCWLAIFAAVAWLYMGTGWRALVKSMVIRQNFPTVLKLHVLFALIFIWIGLSRIFDGYHVAAAGAVAACGLACLARRPGIPHALPYSNAYLIVGFFISLGAPVHAARHGQLHALGVALIYSAAALAFALGARRLISRQELPKARICQWVNGLAAMLVAVWAVGVQDAPLKPYITAAWAGLAIMLFVIGLLDRARPLRLIALGTLGLCVLRVFLVDAQSTYYRIIAFIALGGVLLAVGFLYHRFARWIERFEGPQP